MSAIRPMSTTEVALTCHMVIPAGRPGDAYLKDVAHHLKEDFGIQHATCRWKPILTPLVPSLLTTLFDIQGLENAGRGVHW